MHRLRWNDLEFLHAVAERGSLSGAARALGINHATVLRHIVRIEQAYGVKIFDRPPGGYRLRPEAHEILTLLNEMSRTAARVERTLAAAGRQIEGSFRIATTDTIATLILPRHLAALAARHPNVAIEVAVANTPVDMSRPAAEIVLRPTARLPDGLIGHKACDLLFAVFGSAEYLAAHASASFDDHRWLGVAPPLMNSPAAKWQEQRLSQQPFLVADSFLALAALASAGMGLAMLPAFVAPSTGQLTRAPMPAEEAMIGLWVASHPELVERDHIAALVAYFCQALASDPALKH